MGTRVPDVIITGSLCTGKTSLARMLKADVGHEIVSAREVLRNLATRELVSRADLQKFGAAIEHEAPGTWLADAVRTARRAGVALIVVDAVRTEAQLAAVREVLHRSTTVALTGRREILEERFERRADTADVQTPTLAEAMQHEIERSDPRVEQSADIVIDTSDRSVGQVFDELRAHLNR
jgi:adenylosuccinate synthase